MPDDGLDLSDWNPETETDKVERWRISVCLDLGYDTTTALSIADSDADIHQLADLIRAGCPLELAARIV